MYPITASTSSPSSINLPKKPEVGALPFNRKSNRGSKKSLHRPRMDQGDGGGSSPATRHTLTVTPTGSGSSSPLGGRDISSRKSSTSGEDLHSQLHDFAVSSLTYRDFFPKMREEGGTFSSPTYEEFGTLVERANEWLVNHREFDILNVECVEILAVHNSKTVDPNKASYYETSKDYTEFVRGFRMWLIPSSASEQTRSRGQRGGYIQYFDVVPECTHAGIVTIEYTKLSGLVEALNDKLRHSPINGDILTVQTLTLRFHSNGKSICFNSLVCWAKYRKMVPSSAHLSRNLTESPSTTLSSSPTWLIIRSKFSYFSYAPSTEEEEILRFVPTVP
ncbi:hypothetical protein RvY_08616-2 [Ramazzottius varieornatus]|uniref:Uncharacterized protein n=1 Tax=Ramazzottius varieornatus TaxID=947166 RepID=A0A1D1V6J0_RAMVA|nr:hypothetical protein RvY_08616-2 [Ramazzottius varieornatus]